MTKNKTSSLKQIVSIRLIAYCLVLLTSCVHAGSYIVIPAGKYEIIANTTLPHILENLTGSKTIQVRCLHQQYASELFPILEHPSFTGCSLKEGSLNNGLLSKGILKKENITGNNAYIFRLQCVNSHAASGTAEFSIEHDHFSARLKIKMGAKNMTMTQSLSARKIAACQTQ